MMSHSFRRIALAHDLLPAVAFQRSEPLSQAFAQGEPAGPEPDPHGESLPPVESTPHSG